jgi:uncharacterized membrane protein
MEEKNTKNWSFYTCCFIVYCFIGWVYEVIWEFGVGNGFVNRGFLHGPYLPIYGFGVLILLFLLNKLLEKKIKLGKINITPILVFLAILLIVSVIEYFASFVMELIFHKRWWDYSYDKFNIDGRISLRNSSLLAIGAFALIYLIQPLLNKTVGKISKKKVNIAGAIIATIMIIDFIITIVGYIK